MNKFTWLVQVSHTSQFLQQNHTSNQDQNQDYREHQEIKRKGGGRVWRRRGGRESGEKKRRGCGTRRICRRDDDEMMRDDEDDSVSSLSGQQVSLSLNRK